MHALDASGPGTTRGNAEPSMCHNMFIRLRASSRPFHKALLFVAHDAYYVVCVVEEVVLAHQRAAPSAPGRPALGPDILPIDDRVWRFAEHLVERPDRCRRLENHAVPENRGTVTLMSLGKDITTNAWVTDLGDERPGRMGDESLPETG